MTINTVIVAVEFYINCVYVFVLGNMLYSIMFLNNIKQHETFGVYLSIILY